MKKHTLINNPYIEDPPKCSGYKFLEHICPFAGQQNLETEDCKECVKDADDAMKECANHYLENEKLKWIIAKGYESGLSLDQFADFIKSKLPEDFDISKYLNKEVFCDSDQKLLFPQEESPTTE